MWNAIKNFFAKVFSRTVIFCATLSWMSYQLLMQNKIEPTHWIAIQVMVSVYLGVMSRHYVDRTIDVLLAKYGGTNADQQQGK